MCDPHGILLKLERWIGIDCFSIFPKIGILSRKNNNNKKLYSKMSKWYYVGENSSFDGDMDLVEKMVNYVNIDKSEDIDVIFYYYMSALLSYWVQLEEIMLFDNFEDFKSFYYARNITTDSELRDTFENIQKNVKPNADRYKDLFNEKLENLTSEHKNLRSNINIRGKYHFIYNIYRIFVYIASLGCGGSWNFKVSDNKRNDILFIGLGISRYAVPLANKTGWFSYNTYLYSLYNDLILIGFPALISNADGIDLCPRSFALHDMIHTESMRYNKDLLIKMYDFTMKNTFTVNEKECLLFTIWFIIHEAELNLSDYFNNLNVLNDKTDNDGYFGIKLNGETLNKIHYILDTYNPKQSSTFFEEARDYFITITSGEYLDIHTEDRIFCKMAIIYGTFIFNQQQSLFHNH